MPRARPSASSSSIKMMAGAVWGACWNRARTRAAPTPTNISTNSEPEIEKNGTFASPATALANSVLPVPGGPPSHTPFCMRAPSRPQPSRAFKEVHAFGELVLGFGDARDVVECDAGIGFDIDLGLILADRHQPATE